MSTGRQAHSTSRMGPDFILGGAMKAGTTSLHHILSQHEDIFMAEHELFFFDLDEYQQHPGLFPKFNNDWIDQCYDDDYEENYRWYLSQLAGASSHQLAGEDSTSYLSSRRAPERIASLLPGVKLVFMLRDPVDRLYSHYWYNMLTGKTTVGFETFIQNIPKKPYDQGCYEEGLKRYLECFDWEQIHVIVFEEFVSHPQRVVDNLLTFLGVDGEFSIEKLDSHKNETRMTRFRGLKRLANRIRSKTASRRFLNRLPKLELDREDIYRREGLANALRHTTSALLDRICSLWVNDTYPPLDDRTRRVLAKMYRIENQGLPKMLGRDLSECWLTFQTSGT